MQLAAMQEQMEQVIPEWCAANGFGDDPVTLSTFTELAVRLLSALPRDSSQDRCVPSLEPNVHLVDQCSRADRVTDDSVTQSLLRPFAKGETPRRQNKGLPDAATAAQTPMTQPANTAYCQSPPVEWMPDCSGDWRPLLHDDEWWVVGHYMMYPARNETDAERLCQELVSQN
jgi:hypothetical protein